MWGFAYVPCITEGYSARRRLPLRRDGVCFSDTANSRSVTVVPAQCAYTPLMKTPSSLRELSAEEFERLGPEEKRTYLTQALKTRSEPPPAEPEQPQGAPETRPAEIPPLKA